MRLFAQDVQRYFRLTRKNSENLKSVSCLQIFIYFFHPRLMPVGIYRLSAFFWSHHFRFLSHVFSLLNRVLFGLEIAPKCQIGPGLFLPHPFGIVIGAVSIGENAIIYQNVTIGAKFLDFEYSENNRPTLGNDVVVGTGTIILGPIKIADSVKIGPHQLIKEDLASGTKII